VLSAVERWSGAAVSLYNRTRERADALAARFPIVSRVVAAVADATRDAAVVVNATSVGMRSTDPLPVPIEHLRPEAVVLDLVYRPDETAWVRAARARDHAAADGLCMLLEQGALAFEWWFDIAAPRDVMRQALGAASSP
jgi:shikimate dehydrogenase